MPDPNNASVYLSPEYLKSDTGKQVLSSLYGDNIPESVLNQGTNLTPEWARTLGLNLSPSGQLLPDNSGATDARNGAGMFNLSTEELTQKILAQNYTGGISTSFDPYYYQKKNLESMLDLQRQRIGSQFSQAEEEARQRGEKEVSGAKAQTSRFQGGDMGLDTASAGYIASVQKDSDKRISDLRKAREEAMQTADENYINVVNTALQNEINRKDKLADAQWSRAMDLLNIKQNKSQADFNIISKLSSGRTWTDPNTGQTYKGIAEPEPFFKSSDLLDLMKNMQVGESQSITDPITGMTYTISGIGQPTMDTQIFENTDRNGNVTYTIFNKNTGEIVKQVGAGKIGGGSANTVYSANSLDDLAKLGYQRRMSASGVGWDFFKDGKPITAEQISREQGTSITTLLEGSNNPEDTAKIQGIKGAGDTAKWELESSVWQWLAQVGDTIPDDQKKLQIQQMGLNPETFGIY